MKHSKSFRRLLGVFSICSVSLFPIHGVFAFSAEQGATKIILGEIAWAGSSRSTADEWIEIWNLSDQPVSLTNWSLIGAADNDKKIFFPTEASIPAHGTYLISNYANNDSKSVLGITPDVVTTTIALSNSTLHLALQDASGNIIDDSGTSTAPAAGSSLPIKISMVRNPNTGQWQNATTSINLISEVADLATPGFCDGCAEESAPSTAAVTTTIETAVATSSTATTTSEIETSPSIESTPVVNTESATTSTSVINTEITTAVSNNVSASTTEQIPIIAQAEVHTSENLPPPKPPYGMLRLNEFIPAPTEGKEWIEITSLDDTTSIPLVGCTLHDATGKIFTFTDEHQLHPTSSAYLLIELSSAKLNNDGDTLSLYDPAGQLIDTYSYPSATKGESYIRYPDKQGSWEITREPTPGITNQREQPEPEPEQQTTTAQPTKNSVTEKNSAIETTPVTVTATPTSPTKIAATSSSTKTTVIASVAASIKTTKMADLKTSPVKPITTITKKPTIKSETKTTTTAKPKTPTTKTSTKKYSPIYDLTNDMLEHALEGGIQVRLIGTVATPPGLLNAHAFILLNPQGRGIRVNLQKKFRLPNTGAAISLTGKLEFDDKNIPKITVGAKDTVTPYTKKISVPTKKSLDLLTFTAEDAWSYIQTTGTVRSATNKQISIDADGIEAVILLRSPLTYRGSRLDEGDVINISGILDITGDIPRIIPTKNEDIVLIEHAPKKFSPMSGTTTPLPTYPTWMPVGAAAGMVVVTESAKRLKRRRDLKRLETKLATL